MNRTERKLQERDEQIIAAIMAFAAEHPDVIVRQGSFFRRADEGDLYAACAVGAGVLYKNLDADNDETAIEAFAAAYGVSEMYAIGVSDGFEDSIGVTTGETTDSEGWDLEEDGDYERGWAVGSAIASEMYPLDCEDEDEC